MNTSQILLALFLRLTLAVSHVNVTLRAIDECDPANHATIDSPFRSVNFKIEYPEQPLCDRTLQSGWYRFTNAAGGMMPTSCPPKLQCGTVVPIWMKGTHPSVQDGIQKRLACGNFDTGESGRTPCCEMAVEIAVRNCGPFFVYQLHPPPSCPVAYCAGDKAPCPVGQWSRTNFPPCLPNFPLVKTPPSLSGPHIYNNKTFQFHCEINSAYDNADHRYEVEWTFNGHADPNISKEILSQPKQVAFLEGFHLKNHMNHAIGCQIRSFYDGNDKHKSGALKSNEYQAGLQVTPARLEFADKDTVKEITVTSSVPILCDHNLSCCLDLVLDVSQPQAVSIPTACVYEMCFDDWDDTKQEARIHIPVASNVQSVPQSAKQLLITFEKLLSTGGAYQNIFSGFQIPQVQVALPSKTRYTCSASGDPHITGVDGSYIHLYKTGDFIFYDAPHRDFQVQIQNWPCGTRECICGVTVREKNDVIKITECDQILSPRRSAVISIARPLSPGTVLQRSQSGEEVVLTFPSGSVIKLKIYSNSMTLTVITPSIDKGLSQGICGTNDGNKLNDFKHPNGRVDTHCYNCQPNNFFESWRVDTHHSMFDVVPPLVNDTGDDPEYCRCDQGTAFVNCQRQGYFVNPTPCQNCVNPAPPPGIWTPHKRASLFEDLDEVEPVVTYTKRKRDLPAAQWPNSLGMTLQESTALCETTMAKSQLWSSCKTNSELVKRLTEVCLADILYGETTSFVPQITDMFTTDCQLHLATDPSSYISSPNGDVVMKPEYVEYVCSSVCNLHGHCDGKGHCVCQNGWEGVDCHIQSGIGPQIDRIRNGPLCDLGKRPCQKVFIDASNMEISENVLCRVQPVDENGTSQHQPFISTAVTLSLFRLICYLPQTNSSIQRYRISASLDGSLYGNEVALLVFDSTCMACDGSGCAAKPTSCHIDHKCYRQGETISPADSTRLCDIARSTTQWSLVPDPSQGPALDLVPTISGPNSAGNFTCSFQPQATTEPYRLFWLLDGQVLSGEILADGRVESTVNQADLPTTGRLWCQIEVHSRSISSGMITLQFAKRP